jgi:STE24 endopeptidase
MSDAVELNPERQKKAKEYARISRRLWLANLLISGIYTVAWLLFGWSTALRDWLVSLSPALLTPWLLVPAFLAVFGGILFIIDLPLDYYSGFVLPHRFDQSTQSLRDWLMDQLKGLAIGLPVGLIMIELLYLALRATGNWWWLWAAGGLLVFNVLLSNLAPVLIMPLFNKYVPLGEEHKDLAERLLKLAERAHTRVRGVYKFDMSRRTKSANAALTGIGNTRRIILGDTLINEFTADEIEAVLAHELGHQVHRDIPVLIAFGTLSTLVGFYLASLAMDWAVATFHFAGVGDVAAFPALALVLGLYGFITSPIDNAMSRWRERMADEYALSATGKHEAFASAFIRLANQNLGEVDPEKWVVFMFYSHPPLAERIAMAKNWEAGHASAGG